MSKIGDVIVKLVLKSDQYDKSLGKASQSAKAFAEKQKMISSILTGAWAAVSAAVTKFAVDATKLTQKWGDAWAIEMAGVKEAYSTFVRQISSGDGWNNLFKNMAEAARRAKEIAASMDEIFEMKISLGYEEASINKTISEQSLIMRDTARSEKERQAAAKKVLELEEELAQKKKAVALADAKNYRDQFQLATGLNDQQTDFVLRQYNANRDAINQAREYYAEKTRLEGEYQRSLNAGSFGQSASGSYLSGRSAQAASDALNKLNANTTQAIKDLAVLMNKYDKSNDQLVQGMADAEIAVINVDTEINRMKLRPTAMLGTLTKAVEKADELARTIKNTDKPGWLDDSLFDGTKILSGLTASNEDIGESITEAYAKRLANGVEMMKQVDEQAKLVIGSIQSGLIGGFNEIADAIGSGEWDASALVSSLLNPLADLAISAGTIMMTSGLGIEKLKAALLAFNGVGAIAAGAGLVAVGVAAKAGIAALANAGGSSQGTTTSSASSYGTSGTSQNITSELTVYVKGTIKGSDIVIAGNNTLKSWNR